MILDRHLATWRLWLPRKGLVKRHKLHQRRMQGSHPTRLLSPLIKNPQQITKVEKKIAMKILPKTINAPVPVKKVVVRIAPAQTGKISKIKLRSTIYNNTSRKQQSLIKHFRFEENLDQQKREQLRWKTGDKKGNKKTLYMKSVQKANDLILNVAKQSKLEQNMNYEDRWPLLNFRKELMKVRILINMAAINVMTNKLFENFCIMVILANSFTLAQEDPLEVSVSQTSEIVEKVFLALYSAEMIIKILGLGFILNKGSYLRSVWNILDFVIIGSAYLTIMQTPPAADPEAEIDLDAD
jgi:hypothetical protein